MSTAASMTPTVSTGARAQRDFGDWLSPMLVKELRQGMRSRVFVISFLLVQLAMVVLAILGLVASAYGQASAAVTSFFWTIIAVPLLLVMPVTGLVSIGSEAKLDTLELIFLTRLTARRIIFGKWVALVAQSALLVAAVLPYAVLRYFLGGVDLLFELGLLAEMLFVSALLTAVAVGLSPLPNKIMRVVMVVGLILGTLVLGSALMALLFSPFSSITGGPFGRWTEWIAYFPAAVGVMAFMLEIGAAKLAPAAENHTTSLRCIPLVLAGLAVLVHVSGSSIEVAPLVVVGAILQVVVIFIGLCERAERPPSLYRPFVRRGVLGKLAGRFFYPGWPSAVFYTLLTCALWMGVAIVMDVGDDRSVQNGVVVLTVFAGTLLMPAAILDMFWPTAPLRIVWFLAIYATCSFLHGLFALIDNLRSTHLRPLLRILPPCGLLSSMDELQGKGGYLEPMLPALIGTVICLLMLLWAMRRPWRNVRAAEAQAAQWLEETKGERTA